jgi:ATP-binding cassette subfamily F protein 3
MADPELYNGPADKVTKLQKDLGDIQKKLSAAEDAWMEAHEALEAAEAEATGVV